MRHHRAHHSRPRRRGLFSRITGVFRARQIYLRSDGEVRFITLKPWHQMLALTFGMAGLFWVAFATINVAFKDQLLVVRERSLYEARLEYEDRIAELRLAIDRMNDKLLLDQAEYLDKVDSVRTDHDKLVERQRMLDEFLRQGWLPAKPAQAGKEVPPGEKSKLHQVPAKAPKDSLNRPTFRQKYAAAFRTREDALAPLADLHRLFEAFEDEEAGMLDGVIAVTARQASNARQVFKKLGIDAEAVVAASSFAAANVGGPFIAATAADYGSERIGERIGKVVQNLTIIEKLRFEGGRLPIWLPLRSVDRVSSAFGLRTDPFRRVASMHTGLDLKAPYGSPVLSTASGKVVKAGWDGAYGRLVEIDHGFGVSTRFAHLKTIKVRVGQTVKRGGVVGFLGNTGRSTAYHLHYETRVNGRAIDPVRFWKVRNELLQAISN